MSKRTATSELNHENWDDEEPPEDAGSFTRAPDDVLKKRSIKVAKRRNPMSSSSNSDKPNAFGTFTGFGKTTTTTTTNNSSTFSFLNNLNQNKANGDDDKTKNTNDEYYSKLKALNQSFLKWIQQHVEENPLIDLQPVFKDYQKYFDEIEKLQKLDSSKKSDDNDKKDNTNDTLSITTSSNSLFNFANASTKTFSLTGTKSIFGNTNASFMLPPPTQPASKPDDDTKNEGPTADNEDEPPKVEFTKVVEEGHVYSIRCKVFVKKDNSFGDRGVGTLYIKPITDKDKYQLIVRADTNLGNLLCNFIISESIPMQRLGKKDVMLVVIPTPDTKPPPVPILLRVKTTEDADELLKTLEKYQK